MPNQVKMDFLSDNEKFLGDSWLGNVFFVKGVVLYSSQKARHLGIPMDNCLAFREGRTRGIKGNYTQFPFVPTDQAIYYNKLVMNELCLFRFASV